MGAADSGDVELSVNVWVDPEIIGARADTFT